MNKVSVMSIFLILALLLAACGGGQNTDETPGTGVETDTGGVSTEFSPTDSTSPGSGLTSTIVGTDEVDATSTSNAGGVSTRQPTAQGTQATPEIPVTGEVEVVFASQIIGFTVETLAGSVDGTVTPTATSGGTTRTPTVGSTSEGTMAPTASGTSQTGGTGTPTASETSSPGNGTGTPTATGGTGTGTATAAATSTSSGGTGGSTGTPSPDTGNGMNVIGTVEDVLLVLDRGGMGEPGTPTDTPTPVATTTRTPTSVGTTNPTSEATANPTAGGTDEPNGTGTPTEEATEVMGTGTVSPTGPAGGTGTPVGTPAAGGASPGGPTQVSVDLTKAQVAYLVVQAESTFGFEEGQSFIAIPWDRVVEIDLDRSVLVVDVPINSIEGFPAFGPEDLQNITAPHIQQEWKRFWDSR